MNILSLDPSLTCSGWALFRDDQLVKCGLVRTTAKQPTGQRIGALAAELRAVVTDEIDFMVIEWPQIYKGARQNPNDLLYLAAVAGGAIAVFPGAGCVFKTPREWKGQTPKGVCNKRTTAALGPRELGVVNSVVAPPSLRHNVLDAIGIGLVYLKRR